MPNPTESANIPATRFVSNLSRYANSEVLYYTIRNKRVLAFETYKKSVSTVARPEDKYMVISPGQEYRPDLVSKKVYGVVDFWWKIMEANNIKDVYEFKAGRNIRLPANLF